MKKDHDNSQYTESNAVMERQQSNSITKKELYLGNSAVLVTLNALGSLFNVVANVTVKEGGNDTQDQEHAPPHGGNVEGQVNAEVRPTGQLALGHYALYYCGQVG